MRDHVIAVDVGTGSARAGVVSASGRLLSRREHPIHMRHDGDHVAEYSSEQIWSATALAVRDALSAAQLTADRIAAIAFDATCSLVLRSADGSPLQLNEDDGLVFDTIAWLDHRAVAEADDINGTGHALLAHSGEMLSPEMQMPKLLWLKRNRPDLWKKSGHFFDLSDFLTWKSTGSTARSLCTLTSKWNFAAHEQEGWSKSFLRSIGLEDLTSRGSLPAEGVLVGEPLGQLSETAAAALGLDAGIAVAPGMIDAYAGALGVLGASARSRETLRGQAALIGGTSSCLICFSPVPNFGRSLWGPFRDTVFAGQWLVEAGQSATGGLLNHLIRVHSAGGEPTTERHQQVIARIQELRATEGDGFAGQINILPDFHGNRSPFADPTLTGVISGLTLDSSFDGLCSIYWRACVAIALGLRQILDYMHNRDFHPQQLLVTGGHVKNPLLVELYGDVTGCDLLIPETDDAVLVGTAINAATAARLHPDLASAGSAMIAGGRTRPADPERRRHYDIDFARFVLMQKHRAELTAL
ncbi:FGGY-family carbohydrate kinase [Ciceribacter sp. L1K22]|uniref:FGGY-family carbohydrate kinase n=1 Tax=Ciceribacter sp. L1K22 TaxID=2820275 RepID=UPI001ABE39D1|nr:FGGY-family carbohydrate kinase [Ciceribacter sp. L1K22]MBO3761941.1 FGGY-family carbohydrate kinase [Ciceribacter sp. L1K22]